MSTHKRAFDIRRKPAIIFVLLFMAAGVLLLVITRAAINVANFEAESGSEISPAKAVTDSTASGGQHLLFGSGTTPTPTPPPPPPPTGTSCARAPYTSRPGPTNTGPVGSLTRRGGGTITTSMSNVEFTGPINVSGSGVRLCNFRVVGTTLQSGTGITVSGTNVVLEDGEISTFATAGIKGGNFTARRLKIHTIAGDGIKPETNSVIEYSYIYQVGKSNSNGINYGDCFQVIGHKNITTTGVYCDNADTTGSVNAAYQLQSNSGGPSASNITIQNGWVRGNGSTSGRVVECKDQNGSRVENITVRGNTWLGTFRLPYITGSCINSSIGNNTASP